MEVALEVSLNEPVGINLQSRSDGGYSWEPREPLDPSIEFLGSTSEPAKNANMGAVGTESLTFICHEFGSYELYLDLKRPFETEPAESILYRLTVT